MRGSRSKYFTRTTSSYSQCTSSPVASVAVAQRLPARLTFTGPPLLIDPRAAKQCRCSQVMFVPCTGAPPVTRRFRNGRISALRRASLCNLLHPRLFLAAHFYRNTVVQASNLKNSDARINFSCSCVNMQVQYTRGACVRAYTWGS